MSHYGLVVRVATDDRNPEPLDAALAMMEPHKSTDERMDASIEAAKQGITLDDGQWDYANVMTEFLFHCGGGCCRRGLARVNDIDYALNERIARERAVDFLRKYEFAVAGALRCQQSAGPGEPSDGEIWRPRASVFHRAANAGIIFEAGREQIESIDRASSFVVRARYRSADDETYLVAPAVDASEELVAALSAYFHPLRMYALLDEKGWTDSSEMEALSMQGAWRDVAKHNAGVIERTIGKGGDEDDRWWLLAFDCHI